MTFYKAHSPSLSYQQKKQNTLDSPHWKRIRHKNCCRYKMQAGTYLQERLILCLYGQIPRLIWWSKLWHFFIMPKLASVFLPSAYSFWSVKQPITMISQEEFVGGYLQPSIVPRKLLEQLLYDWLWPTTFHLMCLTTPYILTFWYGKVQSMEGKATPPHNAPVTQTMKYKRAKKKKSLVWLISIFHSIFSFILVLLQIQ